MIDFQINDGVLSPNRSIRLLDFLNGSGLNLEETSQVQFVNLAPTSESGYFRNNQNDFERGEAITIPSTDLASTSFRAGLRGSDRLSVRAMVNEDWSNWQSFSVQVANVPPVVFTSDLAVAPGTRVKINEYFTSSDSNDDAVSHFRIQLSGSSVESQLYFGDWVLPSNQAITIARESLPALEFQLSDLSTGHERIWLSAFDGQTWGEWSAINIYPERTDRPSDLNFIGGFYQKSSNSNGQTIETRIPLNSEIDVWVNETRWTNNPSLQFDPAINEKGDTAWAEVEDSFGISKLILNNSYLAVSSALNYKVQLTEENLYYLSLDKSSGTTKLYQHDLDSPKTPMTGIELESVPLDYIANEDQVTIVSLDTSTGQYHIQGYTPDLDQVIFDYQTSHALSVLDSSTFSNNHQKIIELEGSDNLKTLFFGLNQIFGDQFGEPFAYGNNNKGRLAWNTTYRLTAIRELYEKTGDLRLLNQLQSPILAIINNVDPDGFYSSTRYSRDSITPVSWAVHTGLIYSELLKSQNFLDNLDRQRLITQAEKVWSNLEKYWNGQSYLFPLGKPINYDGIQMPWNQQGSIALMAVELYKTTGNSVYLDRVEQLYNNFVTDLEKVDGTSLWHYWPKGFYEGWNWGEQLSSNHPIRNPTVDELYEDFSHAYLTSIFIREAAEILGQKPPINLDAIANNLEIAPWVFSRFISGDVSSFDPSVDYMPHFVEAPNIAAYYREAIPQRNIDFDSQGSTRAYAQLVNHDQELGESLNIREYSTNRDGIVLESESTVGTYQEILDYYFDLINTSPTVNVNQSNLSWNNGWLQGTDLIEVTDHDNDPITHYRFWHPKDERGYLYIAEQLVEAEGTIPVTAEEFSSTWIHGDLVSSSNPLWVQTYDGSDWSTWVPLGIDII